MLFTSKQSKKSEKNLFFFNFLKIKVIIREEQKTWPALEMGHQGRISSAFSETEFGLVWLCHSGTDRYFHREAIHAHMNRHPELYL